MSDVSQFLGYSRYQFLNNIERGISPVPRHWIEPLSILFKKDSRWLTRLWEEDYNRTRIKVIEKRKKSRVKLQKKLDILEKLNGQF